MFSGFRAFKYPCLSLFFFFCLFFHLPTISYAFCLSLFFLYSHSASLWATCCHGSHTLTVSWFPSFCSACCFPWSYSIVAAIYRPVCVDALGLAPVDHVQLNPSLPAPSFSHKPGFPSSCPLLPCWQCCHQSSSSDNYGTEVPSQQELGLILRVRS